MAWWPRVKLKTMQHRLRLSQTLAFGGMTGVMRFTPIAAAGCIICEEPLHVAITAGAAQAMGHLARACYKGGGGAQEQEIYNSTGRREIRIPLGRHFCP